MHPAISTHRMARNFPCCHRYVLHVSQITRETSLMDLCTGRFFVRRYCTSPKIAPTAHMTMPRYISVSPLMPPSPSKLTCSRPGIFKSASPACRLPVAPKRAAVVKPMEHSFVFCIRISALFNIIRSLNLMDSRRAFFSFLGNHFAFLDVDFVPHPHPRQKPRTDGKSRNKNRRVQKMFTQSQMPWSARLLQSANLCAVKVTTN